MRKSIFVGSLAFALVGLAGCAGLGSNLSGSPGGQVSTGTHVRVTLVEYAVGANVREIPAGPVTFDVRNAGTVVHEMVVLETSASDLTIGTDDKAAEDSDGVKHVGEVNDLPVGKVQSVTLDLQPGTYLLICNVPGHYHSGMFVKFVVR